MNIKILFFYISCSLFTQALPNNNDKILEDKLSDFIYQDNIYGLKQLLNQGININGQDDKATPLLKATKKGNLEIVKLLINHGAKINVQDSDNFTPLHNAVALNIGIGERFPPAIFYDYNGAERIAIALLLLEKGANPNAQNKRGLTPLHLVVDLMDHQFKLSSNEREYAMARFIIHYYIAIAKLLITYGANVNGQNDDGKTPLHIAVEHGQTSMVRLLIERKTNVTIKDKAGKTPMDYTKDPEILDFLYIGRFRNS